MYDIRRRSDLDWEQLARRMLLSNILHCMTICNIFHQVKMYASQTDVCSGDLLRDLQSNWTIPVSTNFSADWFSQYGIKCIDILLRTLHLSRSASTVHVADSIISNCYIWLVLFVSCFFHGVVGSFWHAVIHSAQRAAAAGIM